MAKVCSFGLGSLKNAVSILSALQKNSKKKSKGNHKVIAKLIFLCLSSVCACVRVCVLEEACTQTTTAAGKSGRAARVHQGARTEPTTRTAQTSVSSSHTSSALPQTLGSMFPTPNCAPQRSREARFARTARRAAPTNPAPLRLQRPGIANTHRTGTPPGQSGE